MKTGYSATTLGATTFGAGVLMIGSAYFGVSRGGLSFDPGREVRQVEFDGLVSPIVGNDRVAAYKPTISGTFLEVSDANIARVELGQTLTGTTTKVLTPKAANSFLVKASDYLADVRVIADRGDGLLYVMHFPFALVASYSYRTNDKGEGEMTITLEARLDPAGTPLNLDVAPYRIETRTTVP